MKKTITSALAAYRQYREAKAKSRVYRAVRYALFSIVLRVLKSL